MEIKLNLSTSIHAFNSSVFFKALNQCDNDEKDEKKIKTKKKNQYIITGDVDKYGYLFSSQEIDFENILEYWSLATYYDLKVHDLTKKIIEHMNIEMIRSPKLFEQLITIHRRTFGKIPIDPLFKNTKNLEEIYTKLKTCKKSQHIPFILNEKFDHWDAIIEYDDYLFDVFDITTNSQRYGINAFIHQLVPCKSSFLQKFNKLTCGLIDQTFDWKNVVCAGGMILESISVFELNKFTDIDLFLYGSRQEQIEKARQLCEYFYCRAGELSSVAWIGLEKKKRNKSVITICFQSIKRTVQIICTDAMYIGRIITDFDIYSNSVLYDGQNIMGIKKWFNAVETKITELNPMHCLKTKRLHKTIKKGFLFNKEYHLSDSYKKYVSSGRAEIESDSHYYPDPLICEDVNIQKMCEKYHVDSFTNEMLNINQLIDLKELDVGSYGYFESIDDNSDDINIMIKKGDVKLDKRNNGIIKIVTNINDNDEMIIFSTDYYPCEFAHGENCTGCDKFNFYHMHYNLHSMIHVGDEFNKKYKNICDFIVPLLTEIGIKRSKPDDCKYFKRNIKFTKNAKILLNGNVTTIDQIHNIYKNKIDPNNAPLVKIKCCIKSYYNTFFSVKCLCAEFKHNVE